MYVSFQTHLPGSKIHVRISPKLCILCSQSETAMVRHFWGNELSSCCLLRPSSECSQDDDCRYPLQTDLDALCSNTCKGIYSQEEPHLGFLCVCSSMGCFWVLVPPSPMQYPSKWRNLSQEQPTHKIEWWTGHTFSLLPHNPSCWMESWDFLPCTLNTTGKLRRGASWKAEGYRVCPAVICVFRGKQNGILDEVGWGSQNEWCEEVHMDVVPRTAKSSVTERKRSHEVAFPDNVGCLWL